MVKVASRGITRAKEIYQNRDQRARELKAEGRQIMGYLCLYPVQEMMTAVDLVPYRMFGDVNETITEGNKLLPPNCCAFLRSTLDLGMKGKYDFLTGAVFAHICEVGQRVHQIWRVAVNLPYTHYIDTPHLIRPESVEQHRDLLKEFQGTLESLTGKTMTTARLKKAIRIHNQQRALVRELYDLRKPDPPLISGVETLQVLKAVMSLPIDEGNELLKETIDEVKNRQDGPTKKAGRLLVWGPVVDYTGLPAMIESLDANIVMDDTCVGSRPFMDDVELTADLLDGLAYHYLVDLKCARTVRGDAVFGATKKDYGAYKDFRFGYLGDQLKDWNVNGVVIETMRYCDSHGYELPVLRDYLDSLSIPHISVENDYSEAALAPLRTRIQGFLEVIS